MLQVSSPAGLEFGIVRPSASFLTVVLPPFCSMCDRVEASVWQVEHTVIFGEVAIGLLGVVGFGTCVENPVKNVVACTMVVSTG